MVHESFLKGHSLELRSEGRVGLVSGKGEQSSKGDLSVQDESWGPPGWGQGRDGGGSTPRSVLEG